MIESAEYSELDVTCKTNGCGNCGYTLRVIARSVDPVVFCGVCCNEINDKMPVEQQA